jgi:hypothetical protein
MGLIETGVSRLSVLLAALDVPDLRALLGLNGIQAVAEARNH